jgi:RNA-directed DNA polymerase
LVENNRPETAVTQSPRQSTERKELTEMTRQYEIPKPKVEEAWKRVKAKKGAEGVDGQTIKDFEADLENNLYKIWNRMTAGSYFPPAVRAVEIPKKTGGKRILGVPCVSDRVAQTVTKMYLEPLVEPKFHRDSYGYRPGRSQHDALAQARQRCWKYDWVLEIDIRGYFDNIPHELVMKLVQGYTEEKWILLYVERWLKASIQQIDGRLEEREKGSPQGSVISPLLSNIFLHHAFDMWMAESHAQEPFERYADDIIVHCKTQEQAKHLRTEITNRLKDWELEVNEAKTRIVYCKDGNRGGQHEQIEFTFLGYTFRPRRSINRKTKRIFTNYLPAISKEAEKKISLTMKDWCLSRRTKDTLETLSEDINAKVRGWLQYYGKFYPSALNEITQQLDHHLIRWAVRKYKRFKRSALKARGWLDGISNRQPRLFAHWALRKSSC